MGALEDIIKAAGDVSDIPDSELLRRAVRNAKPAKGTRATYRWVCVMDMFALGSGYAHQLCRRFGFDPDAIIKR